MIDTAINLPGNVALSALATGENPSRFGRTRTASVRSGPSIPLTGRSASPAAAIATSGALSAT